MSLTKLVQYFAISLLLVLSCRGSASSFAYELDFAGAPSSPSQAELNTRELDFVVTHRTHPKEHFTATFAPFPGDHDGTCAFGDPREPPLRQHAIRTNNLGRGGAPDAAFYQCRDHMMTALGDVSGYSVASFFPKGEWAFSNGGALSLDINNSARRRRHWWEILVSPRSVLSVAAGPAWAPISERYPALHVAARMFHGFREIEVGFRATNGTPVVERYQESKGNFAWYHRYPNDPSMGDRRMRVSNRITISSDRRRISWAIQTPKKKWDTVTFRLSRPIAFTRGIVQFKTHSYTPTKDGNMNDYTFHWDNIRLSGRLVSPYENFEAKDVVYLQQNGDSKIGLAKTVTIDVPRRKCAGAVLFGQVHQPVKGEVLLSINGAKFQEVRPYKYEKGCALTGWSSFQLKLKQGELRAGRNTFRWKIGRRSCKDPDTWIGFSVKSLEVQCNRETGSHPAAKRQTPPTKTRRPLKRRRPVKPTRSKKLRRSERRRSTKKSPKRSQRRTKKKRSS